MIKAQAQCLADLLPQRGFSRSVMIVSICPDKTKMAGTSFLSIFLDIKLTTIQTFDWLLERRTGDNPGTFLEKLRNIKHSEQQNKKGGGF